MNLNKHFTILLTSCIALLSMGVSCKDNNPQPSTTGYCDIPGMCETVMEAKDYFCFKMGSWWVYEEETTHVRDSIYVTSYANNPNNSAFTVDVYSPLENYYYSYHSEFVNGNGCTNDGILDKHCVFIRRSKGNFGDYLGEETCFFIQYKKLDKIQTSNTIYWNDWITIADVFASYTNQGIEFPKTVKVHEGHTYVENNNETNHYFSKGIGLVRKELLDSNEVWNLVNYHIEP